MGDKKKCDYCNRWFDFEVFQTLDNGSEACPECVDYERQKEEEN